jgi:hypothetical protein
MSFSDFLTMLRTNTEATLCRWGGIYLSDIDRSENPTVNIIPKGWGDREVDLPKDYVGIASIGSYMHDDQNILRLSTIGVLPTPIVTEIIDNITWGELSYDQDTGYSYYGFFGGKGSAYNHFVCDSKKKEVTIFTDIEGNPISKLEFAVRDDEIELYGLSDGRFYRDTVSLSTFTGNYTPTWEWIEIPDGHTGYDFTTRYVDDKIGTIMATENGVYLYRDGEITLYSETKGKVITRIAAFAGTPYTGYDVENDHYRTNFVFIARDGKDVTLWTSGYTPNSKITRPTISRENSNLLKRNDLTLISDGYYVYFGVPGNWVSVETNWIQG